MNYTVVLLAEADGRYSAFVPALPGTYSWGETIEAALANIAEAAGAMLAALREEGEDIPIERQGTVVTTISVRSPVPVAIGA